MNKLFESLNPEQRAVASCEQHCLAIAAPGSGKTKTLAVKAASLLLQGKTVVAVTFTRDAAIELRERIIGIAGEERLPSLLVGTFHSINKLMVFPKSANSAMGKAILERSKSAQRRPWTIIKEGNRRRLIYRAIQACGQSFEIDDASRLIERLKCGKSKPESEHQKVLHQTYVDLMNREGLIDFQDILLLTNKYMDDGTVSPLAADHLMIDEFQDTDATQFDWAMKHARSGCILTAVGDDDQSIYGFRDALGYNGMNAFKDAFRAVVVVLGTNYRSHAEILQAAGELIAINEARMPKALVAHKGPGGSAQREQFATKRDEALEVHRAALRSLASNQTFGAIARTNRRLDELEAICVADETPYLRSDGSSIFDTMEMQIFLDALNFLLIGDQRATESVFSWFSVSEDEIASLRDAVAGGSLIDLTPAALKKCQLSTDSRKQIAHLLNMREQWLVSLQGDTVDFVLQAIETTLLAPYSSDQFITRNLENVAFTVSKKKAGHAIGLDEMHERYNNLKQASEAYRQKKGSNAPSSGPVVHLITAHGSKGLEYDRVWILGAEEKVFPDETSSMAEERRLFYVAMTRARAWLMVSSTGTRDVSRFAREAKIPRAQTVLCTS